MGRGACDADRFPLPRSARQRRFAAQYAIHMAHVSAAAGGQRPEPIVNILYTAGRAGRLFVGAARLIALSCVHPGCAIPAEFCDVDHLERFADGGSTDQCNATPACGAHNRFKEAAGLRSRRARNGRVYLNRPDGTAVVPAGERELDWTDLEVITDPSPLGRPDLPDFESITWDEYLARRAGPTAVGRGGRWSAIRCDAVDLPLVM